MTWQLYYCLCFFFVLAFVAYTLLLWLYMKSFVEVEKHKRDIEEGILKHG